MTFLNGVAGRSHSREHAINSAKIFSQCKPMLVGTGGLTLFPGTPLLEEAQRGEFDPLTEKEMLEELKLWIARSAMVIWTGWQHSGGTSEPCKEAKPCIFQEESTVRPMKQRTDTCRQRKDVPITPETVQYLAGHGF